MKITITAHVDKDMLYMETSSNNIPTKESIENILNKQFPFMEDIEVKTKR